MEPRGKKRTCEGEPLKRIGGVRQRRAASANAETDPTVSGDSALAKYLLDMFAWGEFSPQRIQKIASLCMQDLMAFQKNKQVKDDLATLSRLGSSGHYANKVHAELMRKARPISNLPPLMSFKTRFKAPLGLQSQSMLLPNELFSVLYHKYRSTWEKTIRPSEEVLRNFWAGAANHPLLENNSIKDVEQWTSLCIPVGMHGDAVPVVGPGKAWVKKLDAYSWFSLVSQRNVREKLMFTYAAIEKVVQLGYPDGTYEEAFQILRWSFSWMMKGLFPDKHHRGNKYAEFTVDGQRALQPLANGFRGFLFALCGDLEYFNQLIALPNYNKKEGPCAICKTCQEGEMTWLNFKLNAPWISSEWKKQDWLDWPQRSRRPIFSLEGASCHLVAYDYMHCKYLGTDMYQFGSCLKLLTHYILPSASPEENLKILWAAILSRTSGECTVSLPDKTIHVYAGHGPTQATRQSC